MDDHLRGVLRTGWLKRVGYPRGGCFTIGYGYETDHTRVFVKTSSKPTAETMFNGELRSLKEILSTETLDVPSPILTGKYTSLHYLVMDYNNIRPLFKFSAELGTSLAQLHLNNIKLLSGENSFISGKTQTPIEKFGFDVPTCCGYIPQNNEWCKNWIQFFTNQKLLPQIQMAEVNTNNREIGNYWSQLILKIPNFFKKTDIKPSLLHGDLWIGNVGETKKGALAFDPASFYGHHEYDLAIAQMFGNFRAEFFDCYHKLIPKQEGFQERQVLYKLFHFLNHWNQFGKSYEYSTLEVMRKLCEMKV